MENHDYQEEKSNETVKKTWVEPEIGESIQIDGYFNANTKETFAGTQS